LTDILVVEDSHVMRRLVEVVLEQIELRVAAVSAGSAACDILRSDPPAVMILDIGPPDMSGWGVLQFVRCRSDLDDTAVIMLTEHVDADDIDRAAEIGAVECLQKPFRPDELGGLVVDALNGRAQVQV
jgi:two-component system OmpR family response regulator